MSSGFYRQDIAAPPNYFNTMWLYTNDWSSYYNVTFVEWSNNIIGDSQWHQYYCVIRLNQSVTNAICADGPAWGYQHSTAAGSMYFTDLVWQKNPAIWPTNSPTGTNFNDLRISITAPSGTVKWTSNNTDPAVATNSLQTTIKPLLTGNSMSISRAVSWSDTALVSDETRQTNYFMVAPFTMTPSQAFTNNLVISSSPSWTIGSTIRFTNQIYSSGPPADASSSSALWPGTQTVTNSKYFSFVGTRTDYFPSTVQNYRYMLPAAISTIISPTNFQAFQEPTNITIVVSNYINSGSISKVALTWRNYSNDVRLILTNNPPQIFKFTWTNRSRGVYPVSAMAYNGDNVSNATSVVVFSVRPNSPAPSVWITSPADGTVLSPGSDLIIQASATNGNIAITNLQFLLDGEYLAADNIRPYEVSVSGLSPGTYQFGAYGRDALGGVSNSSPVRVTIKDWDLLPVEGFWDSNFTPYRNTQQDMVCNPTALCISDVGDVYVARYAPANSGFVDRWHSDQSCGWTSVTNLGQIYGIESMVYRQGMLYLSGQLLHPWDTAVMRYNFLTAQNDDLWVGLPLGVKVLQFVKGELWAGGTFNTNVQYVAKLVSNTWVSVGSLLNGPVYAILPVGDDVYIGGDFTSLGHVAKLSGSNWVTIGAGLNNTVRSLGIWQNQLLAGGDFTASGTTTNVVGLAKWDGTSWTALGGSISGGQSCMYQTPTISSILVRGNDVFVGGMFNSVKTGTGELIVNNIAHLQWNEDQKIWSWHPMDQGLFYDGDLAWVDQLALRQSPSTSGLEVIVTGGFNRSGSVTNWHSARWIIGNNQCQYYLPSIHFIFPLPYENVSTNVLDLEAYATPASGQGIRSVVFYADGVPYQGQPDVTNVWTVSGGPSFSSGVHQLDAVVTQSNDVVRNGPRISDSRLS